MENARTKSVAMAARFTQMTGIELVLDKQHPVINSPINGWTNDPDVFDEDEDAQYVFKYYIPDTDISVYMNPENGTVCVWNSLGDDDYDEGAINPHTLEIEWIDDLEECSYPLSDWKNFSLDQIPVSEDY